MSKRPKKSNGRRRRAGKVRYSTYIHSRAWKMKRQEKMRQVGRMCESCGFTRTLEVHHVKYTRLGRELMSDLRVLCSRCHKEAHGGPPAAISH
jgi:5-methylcytosine-specific restriction endonuclease McrA